MEDKRVDDDDIGLEAMEVGIDDVDVVSLVTEFMTTTDLLCTNQNPAKIVGYIQNWLSKI